MDTALLALKPKFLKRKDSVMTGCFPGDSVTFFNRIKAILSIPPTERTESQISTVITFTKEMKFFSELRKTVGEYAHYQCCQSLTYAHYPVRKVVFKEGDPASQFFIIISGSCSVISQSPNSSDYKLLTILRAGDSFGELALISKDPRAATVLCREPCNFAVLEREDYTQILERVQQRQLKSKIRLLQQHPVFASWTYEDVKRLSYFFQSRSVKRNQSLFEAGQPASELFLLQEGSFQLSKEVHLPSGFGKPPRLETDTTSVTTGELLATSSALSDTAYDSTCTCASASGSALIISKKNFKRMVTCEATLSALKEIDLKSEETRLQRAKDAAKTHDTKSTIDMLRGHKPMGLRVKPAGAKSLDKLMQIAALHLHHSEGQKHTKLKAGLEMRNLSMPQNSFSLLEKNKAHKRLVSGSDVSSMNLSVDISPKKAQKTEKLPCIRSSFLMTSTSQEPSKWKLMRNATLSNVSLSMFEEAN